MAEIGAAREQRTQAELIKPVLSQTLEAGLWFVSLRWAATAGIIAAAFAGPLLGYPINSLAVSLTGFALGLGNYALLRYGNSLKAKPPLLEAPLNRFNRAQILLDWLALSVLIHFSGGLSSPCLFFFFFHIIITAILYHSHHIYGWAALAVGLVVTLFLLEETHLLAPQPITAAWAKAIAENSPYSPTRDPQYLILVLSFFAISLFSTVLIASWVSGLLRRRHRQLAEMKVELEDSTDRLEAIYRLHNELGGHYALGDLLDTTLRQATHLWGIEGVFIALRESDSGLYRFAATHGLALENQPATPEFLQRAPFFTALENGEAQFLNDLDVPPPGDESWPCLDWLTAQGKRALLVIPLHAGHESLGAFVATSPYSHAFRKDDAHYFRIFCDLIANEIALAAANDRLLAHGKTRTWFYHRAAHDLRAPLSAIRSTLELITEGYVNDAEKMREVTGKALKRTAGLSEMVNDLLVLAEDKLDRLADEKTPFDLAPILLEVAEAYEAAAKKKELDFTCRAKPGLPPVLATKAGLERVFNNLISNAIKYTPNGGRVSVTLGMQSPHKLHVVVADSGIGIPLEARAHLFDEFYRAPNARKLSEVGTGLGLSLTRKLVNDLGGNLSYDSRENVGSVFVVSLPTA